MGVAVRMACLEVLTPQPGRRRPPHNHLRRADGRAER